ncbi:MAG TPA: response regulator [Xanthobacteraceae bacterium]|jgi:CheY-like chemotaxis protein|nr:response regulator [Xanthobacteraceae bacterium]
MSDDLLFLRALVVSPEAGFCDLFERAAAASSAPVEIVQAGDAASACGLFAGSVDLVYLDDTLSPTDTASVAAAARGAPSKPFTVQLAPARAEIAFATDALADKPLQTNDAKRLLESSLRTKRTSRVLVVDDSSTMRSIVRKTLAATRFPFEVLEVDEGFTALKLVRDHDIHLVFLDYNLPEFSGLETLAEFKREDRPVSVVMITSTQDEAVALHARKLGAAFLRKPFFPADIETALCDFYGLRALNPKPS